MSTNLTIVKEKDRAKEKVGDRPAKLNKTKSDRELELERKKHENFAAVTKMELSGSEKKVNKNTYISSMKVILHGTICNDDF